MLSLASSWVGDNVSDDPDLSAVVRLVAGGASEEHPLKRIWADGGDAGVRADEPGWGEDGDGAGGARLHIEEQSQGRPLGSHLKQNNDDHFH